MNNKKSTLITFLENFLIGEGFLCCFCILVLLVLKFVFKKSISYSTINLLHYMILIYSTVFVITLIIYLILKTRRRNKNGDK